MEDIFFVLISAALANNIIAEHIVGADASLAAMRRYDVALGVSRTMLILLPIATCLSSAIINFILIPMQLQYMKTFVFILLIISIVYAIKAITIKKNQHPLIADLHTFLPISGINTIVIGTLLLNQQHDTHLLDSLFFGLGTAIGFSIILIALTCIDKRLQTADIPTPFKGIPITLITLGLISMAFSSFTGLAT